MPHHQNQFSNISVCSGGWEGGRGAVRALHHQHQTQSISTHWVGLGCDDYPTSPTPDPNHQHTLGDGGTLHHRHQTQIISTHWGMGGGEPTSPTLTNPNHQHTLGDGGTLHHRHQTQITSTHWGMGGPYITDTRPKSPAHTGGWGDPASPTPDPNHQHTLGDGGTLHHRHQTQITSTHWGMGGPCITDTRPKSPAHTGGWGDPASPTPDPNHQHTLGDGGTLHHRHQTQITSTHWGMGGPCITDTRPKSPAHTGGWGDPASPTPDPNHQHTLGDGGTLHHRHQTQITSTHWGMGGPCITDTRPKSPAHTGGWGDPASPTPDPNHQHTLGDGGTLHHRHQTQITSTHWGMGGPCITDTRPKSPAHTGDGGTLHHRHQTQITSTHWGMGGPSHHQHTRPKSTAHTGGLGDGGGDPTSPTPDPNQQHTLGDGGGEPYISDTRPKLFTSKTPRAAHAPLTCEEALRPAPQVLQQRSPEEGAQVEGLPGASPLKAVEQGGQRQVSRQRQ